MADEPPPTTERTASLDEILVSTSIRSSLASNDGDGMPAELAKRPSDATPEAKRPSTPSGGKRRSLLERISQSTKSLISPSPRKSGDTGRSRQTSLAEKAGFEAGALCWVANPMGSAMPYSLVEVVEAQDGADDVLVTPHGGAPPAEGEAPASRRVAAKKLYAHNADTQPDNVLLFNFSQPSLLDNVIRRYDAKAPYTYTGGILTSVNPCESLPTLYAADKMAAYVGRMLGPHRPPHLCAPPARHPPTALPAPPPLTAARPPSPRAQTPSPRRRTASSSVRAAATSRSWCPASRAPARPRRTRF